MLLCYTRRMAKGKGDNPSVFEVMMEEMRRPLIPRTWLPFRGEEEYRPPRVFRPAALGKPASPLAFLAFRLMFSALMLGTLAFLLWVTYFNYLQFFWGIAVVVPVVLLFVLAAILDGRRRKARKIAFWPRRSPPPEA